MLTLETNGRQFYAVKTLVVMRTRSARGTRR